MHLEAEEGGEVRVVVAIVAVDARDAVAAIVWVHRAWAVPAGRHHHPRQDSKAAKAAKVPRWPRWPRWQRQRAGGRPPQHGRPPTRLRSRAVSSSCTTHPRVGPPCVQSGLATEAGSGRFQKTYELSLSLSLSKSSKLLKRYKLLAGSATPALVAAAIGQLRTSTKSPKGASN